MVLLKKLLFVLFLMVALSNYNVGMGFPVKFALTKTVSITIDQTIEGTFIRMGNGKPMIMREIEEDLWFEPELDIYLHFKHNKHCGSIETLELRRYNEAIHLSAKQDSADLFPGAPQQIPEVFDEMIPRLMVAFNVPGVSIAGIENGRIAWTRAYGVKTAGNEEKITDSTLFEAASMSKAQFAYATLRMVDRGEFDLDIPLVIISGKPYEKVVRDTPGEPFHKKITARMVFQHQTGFPNWSSDDALKPLFEPGTGIGYSGEGFEFCQRVVEDITGLSLNEFMKKELFQPLGMDRSSFVWQDHFSDISSWGHDSDGNEILNRRIVTEGNAAYSLYTTPSEYALFLIDLMNKTPGHGSLLSEESRLEMLNPTVHDPSRSSLPRAGETISDDVLWALSWRAQKTNTGMRFHHGGSNSTGFRCITEFDPASADGIVIMTNATGGSDLIDQVFKMTSLP